MKRYLVSLSAACALAILAVPALAHHSFNTFYDMTRTLKIEGVVKSFRLVSPHSEMTRRGAGCERQGRHLANHWRERERSTPSARDGVRRSSSASG